MRLVAPGERLGPFELLLPLARSRSAERWVAREEHPSGLSRRVALRRLCPPRERKSELADRLGRALSNSERLNHPGLVRPLSLVVEGEDVLLGSELIDGVGLDRVIASTSCCDPRLVIWIVRELARIRIDVAPYLRAATGADEHGHLSAPNVILSRDGQVLLSDLLIAQVTHDPSFALHPHAPRSPDIVALQRLLRALASGSEGGLWAAEGRIAWDDGTAEKASLELFEESLARAFYTSFRGDFGEHGERAIAALVSRLAPASLLSSDDGVGRDRAPQDRWAPGLASTSSTVEGVTAALSRRASPVVPQPLTTQDDPGLSGGSAAIHSGTRRDGSPPSDPRDAAGSPPARGAAAPPAHARARWIDRATWLGLGLLFGLGLLLLERVVWHRAESGSTQGVSSAASEEVEFPSESIAR